MKNIDEFEMAVEAGINTLSDGAKARLLDMVKDASDGGGNLGSGESMREEHSDSAQTVRDWETVYQIKFPALVPSG